MPRFIVKNTDKLCLRINLVGTKAANLARLVVEEYHVPPFFVISTHVLKQYIKRLHHTQIKSALYSRREKFNALKTFFNSIKLDGNEMPRCFWKDFARSFQSLESEDPNVELKVVVRSSSPFEDQVTSSFAGQLETVLDVRGLDAVWEAIKKCWLSLWSENVQAYFEHSDQKWHDRAMAVIIQKMIPANVSGVLFTQDPVIGDDTTMMVEAAQGVLDGVVGGKVEPWRIRIDKETLQNVWAQSPDETDTTKIESQSYFSVLSPNQMRELGTIGKSIEAHFNRAQDIEWAFDQEKLWLLQTRPLTITKPNDRQRRDVKGNMWTDYFFVERFMDPVSPLGWSIIGKWIEKRALREPLFFLGYDDLYHRPDLTRLFDYHPFTRTKVFQTLYGVVPDFAISNDKKQAFLSGNERKMWWIEFIRCLPFLCSRLLFRNTDWIPPLHLRAWEKFIIRYQKQLQDVQNSLASCNLEELGERFNLAESLTDELLSYHRWSITFADLFFHLLEQLVHLWIKDADASVCVDLVSGLPGNKTVEANLELAELAKLLSNLRIKTRQQKERGARAKVTNNRKLTDTPEFKTQLERFLERHGHRSKNLDPYYPTWRDNVEFVIGVINDLSSDSERSAKIMDGDKQAARLRCQTESRIFSNFSRKKGLQSLLRERIFRVVLNMTQSFALLRENQRYYWHMALAEKRRIIMEIGNRLVERGLLISTERTFFLIRNEFLQCFQSNADLLSLAKKADSRFKNWKKSTAAIPTKNESPSFSSSKLFHGIGASAGEVQGRASVVRSLEEAQNISSGTILVTASVDPAWTPIFSKVSGLILEVGGILSHAAIVAREFRLPAVTSVARATAHISDGQLLHIDGVKGTVRIISNRH